MKLKPSLALNILLATLALLLGALTARSGEVTLGVERKIDKESEHRTNREKNSLYAGLNQSIDPAHPAWQLSFNHEKDAGFGGLAYIYSYQDTSSVSLMASRHLYNTNNTTDRTRRYYRDIYGQIEIAGAQSIFTIFRTYLSLRYSVQHIFTRYQTDPSGESYPKTSISVGPQLDIPLGKYFSLGLRVSYAQTRTQHNQNKDPNFSEAVSIRYTISKTEIALTMKRGRSVYHYESQTQSMEPSYFDLEKQPQVLLITISRSL